MIDFEQLYVTFAKRMTCTAYTIVRDWYEAEDVVQEAFLKAFKNMDKIGDSNKIGAWLHVVTVRTAIDFKRAEKRRNWTEADLFLLELYCQKAGKVVDTEPEVEMRLLQDEIRRSLQKLSAAYRSVLLLKWQYHLKEAEIADILHIKSTTVKTRLHRARKQLKEALLARGSAS